MKKKCLKNFVLNKKSISNLSNVLKGGINLTPPVDGETLVSCPSIDGICDSLDIFCISLDMSCPSRHYPCD